MDISLTIMGALLLATPTIAAAAVAISRRRAPQPVRYAHMRRMNHR